MGLGDNTDCGMIGLISKDVGGMRSAPGVGVIGGYMGSSSTVGRAYNDMEMSYMDSMREAAGDFDGMAVSEMFLGEYYSQVMYSYRIM